VFAKKEKDELLELLLPIRRRLMRKQRMRQLVSAALWGTGASLALLVLARLLPIPYSRWLALVLPLIAMLAAALLCRKPNWLESAQTADRQGLQERTVTAWENRDSTAAVALLQREDALGHLRRKLPQILESVRIWEEVKRPLLLTGGLALAAAVLFFIPNPQDDRLAKLAQERQALEEAAQELEQTRQEVVADSRLSEEQKKQLQELLEQAKKALAEADDPLERLNAVRAAQIQLEKWREEEQAKLAPFARLQQDLGQLPGMQGLATALQQGEREALTAALQQMARTLEELTEEERKQLAEELKKVEEQLRSQAEAVQSQEAVRTAGLLATVAEQMALGQLSQAMGLLEQSLLQAQQTAVQQQQALLAAAQAFASLQQSQMALAAASGSEGSAQTAGSAGFGQPAPGSAATTAGSTPGQQPAGNPAANAGGGNIQQGGANSGSASAIGSAGEENSGSASTNGGASQGNGAGGGTGRNGNGGRSAGAGGVGTASGAGSGAGLGAGRHELVTVPSQRMGDASGPVDTVSGPLGAGPSQSWQSANSQVSSGAALPYEEVYAEYEQFARESLGKGTIPSDYQETVKKYFAGIEP